MLIKQGNREQQWKRKLIIVALTLLLVGSLGGCGAWNDAYEEAAGASFTVVSIQGPGALSLLKAMAPEVPPGVRLGDTVMYTFFDDEAKLYAQLMEGKPEIALITTGMLAKLIQENPDFQLAAVTTDGMDTSLPMSCLIVRSDVLTEKAEPWKLFLADFKDSIQWISDEPAKAAALLEDHDIGIPADQAEEVIGRADLIFLEGDQATEAIENYLN